MSLDSDLARAIALNDQGRFAEADELFASIAGAHPREPNVYLQWALTPLQMGDAERGLRLLDQALAIEPRQPLAHYNKARVFFRLARLDEAVESARAALRLAPQFAEAHATLGTALLRLRRMPEARDSLTAATRLQPNAPGPWADLSLVFIEGRDLQSALQTAQHALRLSPDHVEALLNGAAALHELGRHEEALPLIERAVALDPAHDFLLGNLATLRRILCDWRGLDAITKQITDAIERGARPAAPFGMLASGAGEAVEQSAARSMAAAFAPTKALKQMPAYRHDKIRVGYFSSDFYEHATAYLMAELVEVHDRSRFEIIGFSLQRSPADSMRLRLEQGCDSFIDLATLSDAAAVEQVRRMEIDIAVDLKGYTTGSRPVLFANRLAPVQANYLGYPGTMGAPFMDYLIADRVCVPKASEGFYDEKIVRLPDSYQVNDSKRAISARRFSRAELGLPEGGVVLCCFNQSYKLAPESFDIWMRVLKANERAVLWLFECSEVAKANLRREAAARDVAAERLVFAPRMPLADHLARHAAADLFVDTFAYNAHTTASDALWAGLPVVTLLGGTFAGRVCASLLQTVSMPELITRSPSDYEALLMELTADSERRAALRAKLAANRAKAPLFDTTRFARHIETAYLQMHERAVQGLAPDHIDIAPVS